MYMQSVQTLHTCNLCLPSDETVGLEYTNYMDLLDTRTGCNTRSIFKRKKAGLNSEFLISLTNQG